MVLYAYVVLCNVSAEIVVLCAYVGLCYVNDDAKSVLAVSSVMFDVTTSH